VVGIFPDRAEIIRLVGAVLAEQTDEWAEQRRYMGTEILTKARRTNPPSPTLEEVPEAITAEASPGSRGDRLIHHTHGHDRRPASQKRPH
jgi:hypothetical protein